MSDNLKKLIQESNPSLIFNQSSAASKLWSATMVLALKSLGKNKEQVVDLMGSNDSFTAMFIDEVITDVSRRKPRSQNQNQNPCPVSLDNLDKEEETTGS